MSAIHSIVQFFAKNKKNQFELSYAINLLLYSLDRKIFEINHSDFILLIAWMCKYLIKLYYDLLNFEVCNYFLYIDFSTDVRSLLIGL